jgi:hypothetical protein
MTPALLFAFALVYVITAVYIALAVWRARTLNIQRLILDSKQLVSFLIGKISQGDANSVEESKLKYQEVKKLLTTRRQAHARLAVLAGSPIFATAALGNRATTTLAVIKSRDRPPTWKCAQFGNYATHGNRLFALAT